MKAAVFEQAGMPLVLRTIDEPKPGQGDMIIKVHRCGICSSDLHMTSGGAWDWPTGSVPGHEFAGEIVECGPRVEGFRKGELITALPTVGCGICEGCAHGVWIHCDTMETTMGGFGEYMRVSAKAALKLPCSFSLADGALVEPFAVGLFGVRTVGIASGDRVLVMGAGPIALATVFWAKRLGARVAVISRSARRADLALAIGADAFVLFGESENEEVVEALGGSPRKVFDCVGAPGILSKAIEHAAKFGEVASMGFCIVPDPFIPALATMKAIRLCFPLGYALADFQYVADHMLAGQVDPKMIITSVVALDELPSEFERLREPNTESKVQVSPAGR